MCAAVGKACLSKQAQRVECVVWQRVELGRAGLRKLGLLLLLVVARRLCGAGGVVGCGRGRIRKERLCAGGLY